MSKELNTIAPKKYEGSYSGLVPYIDSTNGVKVGDVAIDTSLSVGKYNVWMCCSNVAGNSTWATIGRSNVSSISSISSNVYSVGFNDEVIFCNSSSDILIINLPVISNDIVGKRVHVKKIDSSTNPVVLAANGSNKIDGELTRNINVQFECIEVICNGVEWYII